MEGEFVRTWLILAISFVYLPFLFFAAFEIFLKPLLREMEQIRKLLEFQLPELRKELRIRHNEASRAAYFEKYGVYPDHWETAGAQK